MGPKFDVHFETIEGQDKTPSFFLQMAKQRSDKLTDPYAFLNAQRKLLMLILNMCHGIQPGENSTIPGIMEVRKYSAWIDKDNEAKHFSIKFMANLFGDVYESERNLLVHQKLERGKGKVQNGFLLNHLQQTNQDGSINLITSHDVIVELRANFHGQDVLNIKSDVIKHQGKKRKIAEC